MASNEQILNEANYYLGNNVNVDQASQALGISRRTFQLHMKKLEEIHQKIELPQSFIHREVNVGMSGGEKKKNEFSVFLFHIFITCQKPMTKKHSNE